MSDANLARKAQAALAQAQELREAGEPERAREVLSATIERLAFTVRGRSAEWCGRLWLTLGAVQEELGERELAIRAYSRATETGDGDKQASLRLVELSMNGDSATEEGMAPHYIDYVESGRNDTVRYGALRRLQQILRIELTDRPADVKSRVDLLRRLRGVRPAIDFPKLYLGRACYIAGDYGKTIDLLTTLKPGSGETHGVLNILGRCHEKLGQLDAAKAAYEKSLRQVPNQAGIHFRLGRIELAQAECPD